MIDIQFAPAALPTSGALAILATEDAAATLTAFTAASVLRLFPHLPTQPQLLIVCGGGARNPAHDDGPL